MSDTEDFDPYTVMDPFTGLPPDIDWNSTDDEFESFDDDELARIAAQGDVMVEADMNVQIAQEQLGRRVLPHEQAGARPYIAQQLASGDAINYRAAIDQFYADNPKKKLNPQQLRRAVMAAAVEEANPKPDTEPPGELPAGATAKQRMEHRRARMAWAIEVAREQGKAA